MSILQTVEHALRSARLPTAEGVFIGLTADRARAEAIVADENAEQGVPARALEGMTVSFKDLIDMRGTPTSRGSITQSAKLSSRDAEVVTRLAEAGAICIGKTNLSEFAFSGLGINPHFGTPRNPRGQDDFYICGGSSSGAAASVALGVCTAAVGTDTSGSIRVPASFTGLSGFRGSCGRYSMDGVAGLSSSLDTLGILADSVNIVARVHAVMSDSRPDVPYVVPANISTVEVVLVEEFLVGNDEAPLKNCLAFAERLRTAGCYVRRTRVAPLLHARRVMERHGTIVAAEAAHRYHEVLASPLAEHVDPYVRDRLRSAAGFLVSDYLTLLEQRRRLIRALGTSWPNTVFLFPTTPMTAPRLEDVLGARFAFANARALSHCMVGSYLDMPGMAMPSGIDERGLPTSVLLSCCQHQDDMLLAFCLAVETAASNFPLSTWYPT